MYLLTDIGKTLASDMVQILAGCIFSAFLLKFSAAGENKFKTHGLPGWMILLAASFFGILFPAGTYGMIPVAAVGYAAGSGIYIPVSAIMSNTVFNMLVPFTDAGFVWRTGQYRILTALIIGMCSGLALKLLNIKGAALIRTDTVNAVTGSPGGSPGFLKLANGCFGAIGLYLIVGVILNTIFMKYFFYDMMNRFNIGLIATAVFGRFRSYDITTPVFLQIMNIFKSLMNITLLAALAALFRWKAVLGYYVCFSIWLLLLALINIFI